MAKPARNAEGIYFLTVPLDASTVEDFKPEQSVKVVVAEANGNLRSQALDLNPRGGGAAEFSFQEKPGSLRVFVGPGNATDEEITGLQTLTLDLSPDLWAQEKIQLKPVIISSFYWRFWLRWCRTFVIRGRVVCADGSPVPGAQVCAYDVDYWWWWSTTQLVGCTTTDIHGAFEIKFKWCCGWLPWYWWKYRLWRLEERLARPILDLLYRTTKIRPLPRLSAKPDLSVFKQFLDEGREGGLQLPGALTARSEQSLRFNPPSTSSRKLPPGAIDPTVLAPLGERLLKRLPALPELERYKLWPWYPWQPWWDCNPDILFRVTQQCRDTTAVIVEETLFDVRWDVPPALEVTVTANEKACCGQIPDPDPEGNCVVLARICATPVNEIGGNIEAPATPAGYANPGVAATGGDRPFAGTVGVHGAIGTGAIADYYEFEWSDDGVNWNEMPLSAIGGMSQSFFGPTIAGDPGLFHSVNLNRTISLRNVIETRRHFEATNDPASWGISRLWTSDWSILYLWITSAVQFANGLYYLRMRTWAEADLTAGADLANSHILPTCELATDNQVLVRIDNRLDFHPPDHPCGPAAGSIHLCTIEPDTDIISVKFIHSDLSETDVDACANVPLHADDLLQIDFLAYDPEGHLAYYTLEVTYGDSSGFYVISPAGAILGGMGSSLTPGAATASVPPAVQAGSTYQLARGQGALAPTWRGGTLRLRVPAHQVFPTTCCYQLTLKAYKRTVVSCDYDYNYFNLSTYSFMVVV